MIPNEKLEATDFFQKVKSNSVVLSFLLQFATISPILFFAYIIWPIIFTMLMVQTTDVYYAIELIKSTNRPLK